MVRFGIQSCYSKNFTSLKLSLDFWVNKSGYIAL